MCRVVSSVLSCVQLHSRVLYGRVYLCLFKMMLLCWCNVDLLINKLLLLLLMKSIQN